MPHPPYGKIAAVPAVETDPGLVSVEPPVKTRGAEALAPPGDLVEEELAELDLEVYHEGGPADGEDRLPKLERRAQCEPSLEWHGGEVESTRRRSW
jgi:hypothetical protein